MTLTEITDTRLDTISHARDVLERAREECNAWRGRKLRLVAALAVTEGALRGWENASSEKDRDAVVQRIGHATAQLVGVFGDVIGADAARYISEGEGAEAA